MKNGFFVINKYSQRIEFICSSLEHLLNHFSDIFLRIKGRIPKTDIERISVKISRDFFGLTGNYSLSLNIDAWHQNKIVLYRYMPYELSVCSGKSIIAEFPLQPEPAKIFFFDDSQHETLERKLTELEYKNIISGFEEK